MKHWKTIIIGVLCAALILGYYYYLSTRDNTSDDIKDKTEVEKVIELDLADVDKYPSKPREVVKVFNRILCCYYNDEYSEKQFKDLAAQQRLLLDEELLANNPEKQFLVSVRTDIEEYKKEGKTISDYILCGTDDVIYKTVDGRECAYVTCSYYIRNGKNGTENTNQCYVLRKDDNGNWKILVYYLIEGETEVE